MKNLKSTAGELEEMISKMKSKAPTLEIKAFASLRGVVFLKVQQAR